MRISLPDSRSFKDFLWNEIIRLPHCRSGILHFKVSSDNWIEIRKEDLSLWEKTLSLLGELGHNPDDLTIFRSLLEITSSPKG